MIEVIYTCKCGDTEEFAKNAYRILFSAQDYPQFVNGRIAVKAHAETLPPDYREMALALARSKDKFAYYFSEQNGVWDLLKGVQVC